MAQIRIIIDKAKIRRIQRLFAAWPNRAQKIFKESINRTLTRTRTRTVTEMHDLTAASKKDIRSMIRLRRATLSELTGTLTVKGAPVAVTRLGFRKGRQTKKDILTTPAQAGYLFHRVFKERYGDQAVFSYRYRIRRKVYDNMTYVDNGHRVPVPAGAFWTTVRGRDSGVFRRKASGVGIEKVTGPRPGEILSRATAVLNRIKRHAGVTLNDEIDRRVARFLAAQTPGRAA